MGWGDEIMVTGEARRLQEADARHRPVVVHGHRGQPRWSPLWDRNPRILRPEQAAEGRDFIRLVNGPRCRPYVDYARMEAEFKAVFPDRPFDIKLRDRRFPWRYTDWRATPGELHCVERPGPRGYIVVEPNLKGTFTANKDWGWGRWQALVHSIRFAEHPWVQLGAPGTRVLDGVQHMPMATFPDACAALSRATAAVLPEGGLHHAAAALGVPAIVIFSGMLSPANTGYDCHVNLFEAMGGESPCGQRVDCDHCTAALAAIRPDAVADHLKRIVQKQRAGAA